MKRLIVASCLLFFSTQVKVFGADGSLNDYYNKKLWRSSVTVTSIGDTLFATAPIVVHNIIFVTTQTGSNFYVFDSTNNTFTHTVTTKAVRDSANATSSPEFDVPITSNTHIRKTGTNTTILLWDWVSSFVRSHIPN